MIIWNIFYAIDLADQEPNDIIPNGDSPPVDPLEPTDDDEGEDILNRHRAYSKIDFGGVNSQKAQMSVTWMLLWI